jgi:hypothetical protein
VRRESAAPSEIVVDVCGREEMNRCEKDRPVVFAAFNFHEQKQKA